jgi:ATP-dependent protease HslVU (ClpYQ) peptidase subunit
LTVIAWDGTSLCADKRALNGTAINTTTKVHRVHTGDAQYLAAFSGSAAMGEEMLEWFRQGGESSAFPAARRQAIGELWAALIVVAQSGRIYRYEDTPFPICFEQKQYAAGSGADFARMAMHLGTTAKRAVELTAELDSSCGNGVDEVRFE